MIGKTIGGHKILSELGRGGMGIVYKAEQISLGRMVAMKVLPPHVTENSTFVERFMNEARSIAKLNHPNVVQIFNVGQEGQAYYYTMEFIDGYSLDKVLHRQQTLPAARAIGIIGGVANALNHIHKHGMVHRDIKPGNILIDKSGRVKLADFGLALHDSIERLTTEGAVLGTPHYLSPEQASGASATALSDIYSLGAVFYELMTGKAPFQADSLLGLIRKIQTEEPPPPRSVNLEIPSEVECVILTMMAKDPAHRHQNCEELLTSLKRLRSRKPSSAPLQATRPKRRLMAKAIMGMLFVAMAGGIGIHTIGGLKLPDKVLAADSAPARRELEQARNMAAADMIPVLIKSPVALANDSEIISVEVEGHAVVVTGTVKTETPERALKRLARLETNLRQSCEEVKVEEECASEGVSFRIGSKPLSDFIECLRRMTNPQQMPCCFRAWDMAEKRRNRGDFFSERSIHLLAGNVYDGATELYARTSEIARLEASLIALEHELRLARGEAPGGGFLDTIELTNGRDIKCRIVFEDPDAVRIRTGAGFANIPRERIKSVQRANPEANEKLSNVREITAAIRSKQAELESIMADLRPFSVADLVKRIPLND